MLRTIPTNSFYESPFICVRGLGGGEHPGGCGALPGSAAGLGTTLAWCAILVIALCACAGHGGMALASDQTGIEPPEVTRHDVPDVPERTFAASEPWQFSFDVGVDYLSAYYYRGLGRENQDHIIHPYAQTQLRIWESRQSAGIDHVDARFGFQSSHHWGAFGDQTSERWVEFNWYGGMAVGFLERWELEALYVNREDIHTASRDVHQIDFRLGYDDSTPAFEWSLQPYVELTVEYENGSDGQWIGEGGAPFQPTTIDRDDFSRGVFLGFGIEPEVPIWRSWVDDAYVTARFPARVGLSLSDYYQDPSGRDSTFGYASLGAHVAWPVAGFESDSGRPFVWSLHAGGDVLYFGSSVRRFNRAVGVGGRSVTGLVQVGLSLRY